MYKGWDILTLTFRLAEGEAPITGHQIVKLKDDSTQDDAFEIEVCQDDTELPLGVAQVDEGSEIKAGEVVPVMIRGVSRVIAGAATINPRDTVSPGGFGLAAPGTTTPGRFIVGWALTRADGGVHDSLLIFIDPEQYT
jgi:hypothetical protein